MSEPKFVIGQRYYTIDGSTVTLLAQGGGQYFVRFVVEVEDWDGEVSEREGTTTSVDKLYVKPPKHLYAKELQDLKNEYADMQKLLHEACENNYKESQRAKDIKEEHARLLKKFKQLPALKHIEDFLEGRITHVVEANYNTFTIKTIEELTTKSEYGSTRQIQLISLMGEIPNGELQWSKSHYSDGSGSRTIIYPCTSLKQAETKQAELILGAIKESLREHYDATVCRLVKQAMEMGIKVSAEASNVYLKTERVEIAKAKKRYQEDMEMAARNLKETEEREAAMNKVEAE